MNIGFDASRAFTKNRTGTENYSYQILHNLSLIDHTNTYYVYIRPNCHPELSSCHPELVSGSAKQKMLKPTRQAQGLEYIEGQVQHDNNCCKKNNVWPSNFRFITIPYPRLWTQVGLAKQTFIDKLDILFVPAHTLPLIRKPGLKTVATVHDLGAEYLPQTHQLKQRLYLKLMTDFQLKSATHLIAVSKATKDDLILKVGISTEKISVIYEGYNEKLFASKKGQLLKDTLHSYGLQPDNYFLFVGTIQPRKNLERLIRAYANFVGAPLVDTLSNSAGIKPAPTLVLAGSKGWLSDEIYRLPKKLGIGPLVKFLGYVPDEKLPTLYSGAKAFLFPSLFEGFGLPILEAMACGCPVLTSNVSSMPEVAGGAAVLVNPYSTGDITQGIRRIMNKELKIRLIKKGFKQAEEFSWQKAAQATLEVFKNI